MELCMGKWKTISIVNLFNYSVIWNNIYAKCKGYKRIFHALEIFEIIWLKFSYFLSSNTILNNSIYREHQV